MGTRTATPFGVSLRTTFFIVLLVVLGSLVWRVYAEDNNNVNYDYAEEQVKYEGLLQTNFNDQKLNAKDILPEGQDTKAYDATAEAEAGQDEYVMYEDEAQQQKQFNYFDDKSTPQTDQKEGVVDYEQQTQENAQNAVINDPVQKDFYEQYTEDTESNEASSSQDSEGELGFEQEYYGNESEATFEIENESQSSEESSEEKDTIYVEDQGDAEIKRAFPDLANSKSSSNSESKNVKVDDYFPTYEGNYNDNNNTVKPADNSAQQGDATSAKEEQQPYQEDYRPGDFGQDYAANYEAKEEAKEEVKDKVGDDTTGATTQGDGNPYIVDPFQSALEFKDRIDALYNAQIEGMNYRNYIFDGAQFVSQLRQNLLEELARFRDGFNSAAQLPLVESPPSVDVREGDDVIVLDAHLPGTLRKSIRLELQNQQLILSGTRERRCPYSYGTMTFFHSFSVPRGVRSDDITAQFDDEKQTIQIRIQKPNENRPDPTRITIN